MHPALFAPAIGISAFEILGKAPDIPKVFVFDLDNTLWSSKDAARTNPPYRSKRENEIDDSQGISIKLHGDTKDIFRAIRAHNASIAIASLNAKHSNCVSILEELGVWKYLHRDLVRIHSGAGKNEHLSAIRKACKVDYKEWIFFDDIMSNINAARKLGITAVHVSQWGLSASLLSKGLSLFSQCRKSRSMMLTWLNPTKSSKSTAHDSPPNDSTNSSTTMGIGLVTNGPNKSSNSTERHECLKNLTTSSNSTLEDRTNNDAGIFPSITCNSDSTQQDHMTKIGRLEQREATQHECVDKERVQIGVEKGQTAMAQVHRDMEQEGILCDGDEFGGSHQAGIVQEYGSGHVQQYSRYDEKISVDKEQFCLDKEQRDVDIEQDCVIQEPERKHTSKKHGLEQSEACLHVSKQQRLARDTLKVLDTVTESRAHAIASTGSRVHASASIGSRVHASASTESRAHGGAGTGSRVNPPTGTGSHVHTGAGMGTRAHVHASSAKLTLTDFVQYGWKSDHK